MFLEGGKGETRFRLFSLQRPKIRWEKIYQVLKFQENGNKKKLFFLVEKFF